MSVSVNLIEVYWLPASELSRIRLNSDRGAQYESAQITAFAAAHGITRSMGYTGICWDCQSVPVGTMMVSEVLAVTA